MTVTGKNEKRTDDGFWDLSDRYIPKKTVITPKRDVSSISISVGEEVQSTIKPQPIERKENTETKKTSASFGNTFKRDNSFVKNTVITPWTGYITLYTQFDEDASYYYSQTRNECPYEMYTSYFPMFSNASKRQISYYIYWRNCLREGKYLTTDQNYIGLYLNECISSLRFRDPNDVISDMINVWKGYREECQFLDKYVFEHITDIILKYNIEASDEICDYAKDVLDDISLPELFFKRDMNNVSLEYIMKRIGYTYKDSKFYKENKDIYEKHIQSCAIEAIRKFMCNDDYMLMYKLSHDLKEAFSGACVSTENKCWISVSYISIVRNGDLKNDIIQIIKYCENVFRDYVGIKTKYAIKGKMPIEIILFIDNYFKENMGEKRASIISSEKEPEYMKYYEPENKGEADESRASDIENEAWQIAEMLEPEEYTEEEPETETQAVPGNETDDVYRLLYNSLDDDLKDGLKAVYEGTIESFATDKGLMEEEIVRRINELAFDITGDIIIENGEIIEDYREDIERLLEENHG